MSDEKDRATVFIDTGVYDVRVWGQEGDDLNDVLEAANAAADRAMKDVFEYEELADDDSGLGAA